MSRLQQHVIDVLDSMPEEHPDFQILEKIASMKSMNDRLLKESGDLARVKDIIRSFVSRNFFWKSDLQKGFRHALRVEEQ